MSFALDLKAFAEKANANAETVIKKVAIDLLNDVIDRSPVGKPEIWAANAVARQYNDEVARLNAELRNDPANLNKRGLFKPGIKINDSMDLVAGKGYVGGRFRGNWQVSFDTPKSGVLDRIDKSGDDTKAAGAAVIQGFTSGVSTIWLMNNIVYSLALEYGHSTQAPAGMTRISVLDAQAYINDAIAELP